MSQAPSLVRPTLACGSCGFFHSSLLVLRPAKSEVLQIVKVVVWPVVAALGLFLFRKPLRRFLSGLGQRITKLSVFHVDIQLAEVTTSPLALSDFTMPGEDLSGGEFSPSYIEDLLKQIRTDAPPCYFIVDIGEGKHWLISRVFLFTYVLWKIGAIRCVVFVERRAQYKKRLLGVASPAMVCSAIGKKYDWFDSARTAAWALKKDEFDKGDIDFSLSKVHRAVSSPFRSLSDRSGGSLGEALYEGEGHTEIRITRGTRQV